MSVRSLIKIAGNEPDYQMVGNGNRHFAKHNEQFRAACERAGVEPTKRQASKWRMKRGLAYKNK